MQTKTDLSYGIIPIRRAEKEWEVLLIHQYSRIGNNTYWVLPKGHPEANETPQQTALRELKEETGLVPETVIDGPTFELQYSFEYEGVRINKTVVFFIGIIATDSEITLDPEEVKEAGWYSLDEALKRIDYQDTKTVFLSAKQYIEEQMMM